MDLVTTDTRTKRPRMVTRKEVQGCISQLRHRPELVQKESLVDPGEAAILEAFDCDQYRSLTVADIGKESGQPANGLALTRLVRKSFLEQDGGRGRGTASYTLTSDGHEALHGFLRDHWRLVMPNDVAEKRCACGPNVQLS
jgi:hypothetical protein